MTLIKTQQRLDAQSKGLTMFEGWPCGKCGQTLRAAKDGICVTCRRARNRKWATANPTQYRNAIKNWEKENAEKMRKNNALWAKNNPDKRQSRFRRWTAKNRDKMRAYHAKWRIKNVERCRADDARRLADTLRRTPVYADLAAIERIYQNCPKGYHVDHVIPLRGKIVSGFHIESNLQYLPSLENQTKHNKFEPIFTSGDQCA